MIVRNRGLVILDNILQRTLSFEWLPMCVQLSCTSVKLVLASYNENASIRVPPSDDYISDGIYKHPTYLAFVRFYRVVLV